MAALMQNATSVRKNPLAKRIIPCLDILNGRVVKGVNFIGLSDAGDPIEAARRYNDEGADELCFLDVTASSDARGLIVEVLREVAKEVFIPLTVGGGINSLDDIYALLHVGCDKASLNSGAVKNPRLIDEAAKRFGSSTIVAAIDAKKMGDHYNVFIHGGRIDSGLDALEWAKEACDRGAGEILLTSMDTDGVKNGYDLEITSAICDAVSVPMIASGGAGTMAHIKEAFDAGADAALAASIFHYGEIAIGDLKRYLAQNGVEARV
jgi:cyclase